MADRRSGRYATGPNCRRRRAEIGGGKDLKYGKVKPGKVGMARVLRTGITLECGNRNTQCNYRNFPCLYFRTKPATSRLHHMHHTYRAIGGICVSKMDTTVRNLDEQAYRLLRARAVLEGKTVGELMNEAIRAYL